MGKVKTIMLVLAVAAITSCWWASFTLDNIGEWMVLTIMPAAIGSIILFVCLITWIIDNWEK